MTLSFRKLSDLQLSLMKSFAELEDNTRGTVNGVKRRKGIYGYKQYSINDFHSDLSEERYSAKEDEDRGQSVSPIRRLKNVLRNLFLRT